MLILWLSLARLYVLEQNWNFNLRKRSGQTTLARREVAILIHGDVRDPVSAVQKQGENALIPIKLIL
ncbi:hypothetical protein PABG_11628 [Paracoccidioides brasiliensis Pb03]|uniref:Uncharacterized protein n=2 Tax=Paracoccidioides brasiliensis TaxID=121759 RepID=A0A0A0HT95_PARBD|nr:uncharacterized protein PADG_11250 [Paracoccidioides brasiliensis Pb18]KGM92434.1 hypothetical protein PADG_11250 [Paracoccidioides brasiliensis Pb18]KGY15328.1 hypothetical protein PABG_11628 [Paracoccidioides brasiliensis Pb03]ODH51330.1 hypothetical protein GX48_02570 [Paracoccidioides brasiliensis]